MYVYKYIYVSMIDSHTYFSDGLWEAISSECKKLIGCCFLIWRLSDSDMINFEACAGWRPLQRSHVPLHNPPPCGPQNSTGITGSARTSFWLWPSLPSPPPPLLFVSHWASLTPFPALNRQQPTGQVDRWLEENDDEVEDNEHFNEISGSFLQRPIRAAESVSMLANFSSCLVWASLFLIYFDYFLHFRYTENIKHFTLTHLYTSVSVCLSVYNTLCNWKKEKPFNYATMCQRFTFVLVGHLDDIYFFYVQKVFLSSCFHCHLNKTRR